MTTKEFLLDQFTSNYDTDRWFVALKNTFKNLTVGKAIWKVVFKLHPTAAGTYYC